MFRKLDLDMLIAARTAPRQSYINPVKRIISLSNIAEIETDVVHKKLPACSRGVKAWQKCVLLLTFSDITLNSKFPFLTKWKSTKLSGRPCQAVSVFAAAGKPCGYPGKDNL